MVYPIIKKDGYVELIFEEDVNDIERKGRKYLSEGDKINCACEVLNIENKLNVEKVGSSNVFLIKS